MNSNLFEKVIFEEFQNPNNNESYLAYLYDSNQFNELCRYLSLLDNDQKKFDDIFPKLAEEYDLTLIPFLLKKVALNPKLNQSDGIHPNFKGAKVISKTIKESIINFD